MQPQPISIENYPRPVWCVAADGGVLIKDSGWNIQSLYGTVRKIDQEMVGSIIRKGLLEGSLGDEEVAWLTGSRWQPFARVVVC